MKRLIKFGVAGMAIHRRNFMPAILLALCSLTLATAATAAELVTNGGFEEPIVDPNPEADPNLGWATYYGENLPLNAPDDCPLDNSFKHCNDDVRVPGWKVFWTDLALELQILEPGRLEIQNNTVTGVTKAKSGEQKAELDSHHRMTSDDNNATIVQFLPTCPRSAYTLTYAWKSRTTLPNDNDVRVVVRDSTVRIHTLNTDWEEEEYNFVSDDSYETGIAFASIGDSTTQGGFLDDVSVTGRLGGNAEACDDPEPGLICELGKPQVLTLLYDGNEFSQHNQNSNEVIITDPPVDSEGKAIPYPNPALIKVYGHKKKSPVQLNSFSLEWGETFDVSGPHNRIPPRLKFEIIDPDTDEVFQTVQFHTSCSQPLEALDEFGGITVWGAKINEVNKTTPAFDNNL
jgi:hypothetical protein